MATLHSHSTWNLVPLLLAKDDWRYGKVDGLKAHLVAKDYIDTWF